MTNPVKEKIKQFQDDLKAKHLAFFQELFAPAFKEHLVLKYFGWKQATPYFCDGNECVFRVNDWSFSINGMDEDSLDWDDNYDPDKIQTNIAKLKREKAEAVVNEDYLKANEIKNEIGELEIELLQGDMKALKAAFNAAKAVWANFEEEMLRSMFGDHVEITVYPNKIETTQYRDHE